MMFENKKTCFRAVSNSANTYPKTEEEKEFERGYQDYMREYEKTAYQRGRDQAARDKMNFRQNGIANLYLGGILGFVFTRMVDTLPLPAAGI